MWTGENTHKRNLQTALAVCRTELVAFIEDDDWYHPEYLERSLNKTKEGYGLVGEANARYYHLPTCSYRMMKNRGHASLSQSLMHRSMLPCLLDILATNEDSFDILLWQASWKTGKPFLFPTSTHVVGVKGMPGRPGVGLGHRPGSNWSKDTGCDTLQQWIGPDAQLYTEYLAGALLQRLRGIL